MLQRFFLYTILVLTSLGFRTFYPDNRWNLSRDSNATQKLFIRWTNGSTIVPNDVDNGDPFLTPATTLTLDQVILSILEDFNSINASYIQLVPHTDPDFSGTTDRLIELDFSGSSGQTTGQAKLNIKSGRIIGCKIESESDLLNSAQDTIQTVTHELGHCLGLDHPQETVHAIMSYYSNANVYRLLPDDKMGIIFLFPADPAKAREKNTFGLSCSKK